MSLFCARNRPILGKIKVSLDRNHRTRALSTTRTNFPSLSSE
jgi:hypothetical protein